MYSHNREKPLPRCCVRMCPVAPALRNTGPRTRCNTTQAGRKLVNDHNTEHVTCDLLQLRFYATAHGYVS